MIKIFFLVLFTEIWNTIGQVFFKKATQRLETPHLKSLQSYGAFVGRVLQMPVTWLGFASLATGVVFWLMALSQGDLSLVYPIGSLQYVLTLFAAGIFLNEKIDRTRMMGTLFITLGFVLIAKN